MARQMEEWQSASDVMGQARSVHAARGARVTGSDVVIALGQRVPVPIGFLAHPLSDARGSVLESGYTACLAGSGVNSLLVGRFRGGRRNCSS